MPSLWPALWIGEKTPFKQHRAKVRQRIPDGFVGQSDIRPSRCEWGGRDGATRQMEITGAPAVGRPDPQSNNTGRDSMPKSPEQVPQSKQSLGSTQRGKVPGNNPGGFQLLDCCIRLGVQLHCSVRNTRHFRLDSGQVDRPTLPAEGAESHSGNCLPAIIISGDASAA